MLVIHTPSLTTRTHTAHTHNTNTHAHCTHTHLHKLITHTHTPSLTTHIHVYSTLHTHTPAHTHNTFIPYPPRQVVAFICIITAAVALDDLDNDDFDFYDIVDSDADWEDTASLARSACGFLIFLAIMVMLLEGVIIALRFLNFGIVDRFTLIFHLVVGPTLASIYHFSVALISHYLLHTGPCHQRSICLPVFLSCYCHCCIW